MAPSLVRVVMASSLMKPPAVKRVPGIAPGRIGVDACAGGVAGATVGVDNWLTESGLDAKVILQVHDELVLEVREDLVAHVSEKVREYMSAAAKLDVPLVVDVGVGDNWDEAH